MNITGFLAHLNRHFWIRFRNARRSLRDVLLAIGDWRAPVIRKISHPATFARRYGDFTANIVGVFSNAVVKASYTVNGGTPRKLTWQLPRMPRPLFVIEIADADLLTGENVVVLSARTWTGKRVRKACAFGYDDRPVSLPVAVDWGATDIDAQDGQWETVTGPLGRSVRLVPGHELYDRIVAVTGAFAPEREIHTELIFRRRHDHSIPFGFGVLPLWGGRPENRSDCPRAGWNFALTWYYSHYAGVGMEFSYCVGVEPPDWVAAYRNWDLKPGERYKLRIVIVEDEHPAAETPVLRQRMKWWRADEAEPDTWLELADVEGCRLPEGEFCVALIAHNCSVEFGEVRVGRPAAEQKTGGTRSPALRVAGGGGEEQQTGA